VSQLDLVLARTSRRGPRASGRRNLNRRALDLLGAIQDAASPDGHDAVTAGAAVDPDWCHVDLLVPSDPAMVLHLRIETWFPYDDATAAGCRLLGKAGPA